MPQTDRPYDISRDELRGQGGELLVKEFPRMPRRMQGAINEWAKDRRGGDRPNRLPLYGPSTRDAGLIAYKNAKGVVRYRDATGKFVSTPKARRLIGGRGRQTRLGASSRYREGGGE